MKYCEECMKPFEEDVCPLCGEKGRELRDDDQCLVCVRPQMWAEMLGDVLEQNSIPCLVSARNGAAMRLFTGGGMMDESNVFVPVPFYNQAKELEEALFSQDAVLEDDTGESEEEEAGSDEEPPED